MSTEILSLKKEDALKAFKEGSKSDKELLKNLYPKVFQNVRDRIQSMEDALAEWNEQDEDLLRILNYKGSNPDMLALRSAERLFIGIRVLNEGVEKDYDNRSQLKYEPRFKLSSAGSGFSYYDCGRWDSCSYAGSSLAYVDYDSMIHGIKIFQEDYKVYYKEKIK